VLRLAESELTDVEAKRQLREEVLAHPDAARKHLAHLAVLRDDFVRDRAFRLLAAAVDDSAVEPIPPGSVDLFAREEQLGRMTIREAFARLTELCPELAEFEAEAAAGRWTVESRDSMCVPLGGLIEEGDPLLRSDLMLNIAMHYLMAVAGSERASDVDSPYLGARRRFGVTTATISWKRDESG
jgi:hypothetical protein